MARGGGPTEPTAAKPNLDEVALVELDAECKVVFVLDGKSSEGVKAKIGFEGVKASTRSAARPRARAEEAGPGLDEHGTLHDMHDVIPHGRSSGRIKRQQHA